MCVGLEFAEAFVGFGDFVGAEAVDPTGEGADKEADHDSAEGGGAEDGGEVGEIFAPLTFAHILKEDLELGAIEERGVEPDEGEENPADLVGGEVDGKYGERVGDELQSEKEGKIGAEEKSGDHGEQHLNPVEREEGENTAHIERDHDGARAE